MRKISKILIMIMFLFIISFSGCKQSESSYTLTLKYEDGIEYKTEELSSEDEIQLDNLVKEGYRFLGWFNGDVKVESPISISSDTILIAKFEKIIEYTYKFIVDEEVIKEETKEVGSNIEYPADPYKEGFTFIGWDKDDTELKEDITFTAIFEEVIKEFTYKFVVDGEVIKEETKEEGSAIVYPSKPYKEGFRFIGWDKDDTELKEDITFTAIFEEIIKYTYKFVVDGEVIKEEKEEVGSSIKYPVNPYKKGFIFIGWDKDDTELKEDITFTAIFEEKEDITSLEGLKVSFLGDSITTFYKEGSPMNSYYGGTGQFYYPLYSSTVKTVDLTWWAQLLNNAKMELGINNSWSGSCAVGSGESAGCSDNRLNTLTENGANDIVIVYLGTNDLVNGYSVEQFREAIEKIISKVRTQGSAEVFLTTLGYTDYTGYSYTEEKRIEYNEELRKIATEKSCGIIPLDDYIIDDNYMIYLGDKLHYNLKGATLLSKISQKAISEYFGIAYDEEIEVEHQEKLPEGVLAIVTATADDSYNFWQDYGTKIFFTSKNKTNAPYSLRIQISKDATSGKYYVISVHQSGEAATYNCDYLLQISEAYQDYNSMRTALKEVVVGTIVEFDESNTFPKEITFKKGDGGYVGGDQGEEDKPDEDIIEGQLHIGAYNSGVWTQYESTCIAYSQDMMDKASTFVNFYIIKLTKNTEDDNYTITGLKPVNENAEFSDCDYYILIFSTREEVSYYNNAKLGDTVIINGDITTGNANLEFK